MKKVLLALVALMMVACNNNNDMKQQIVAEDGHLLPYYNVGEVVKIPVNVKRHKNLECIRWGVTTLEGDTIVPTNCLEPLQYVNGCLIGKVTPYYIDRQEINFIGFDLKGERLFEAYSFEPEGELIKYYGGGEGKTLYLDPQKKKVIGGHYELIRKTYEDGTEEIDSVYVRGYDWMKLLNEQFILVSQIKGGNIFYGVITKDKIIIPLGKYNSIELVDSTFEVSNIEKTDLKVVINTTLYSLEGKLIGKKTKTEQLRGKVVSQEFVGIAM